MKLGHNLQLDQSQKLIVTPQLRQAIELLQFNSMELNEYLKEQMQENPLLEMEDSSEEFTDLEKPSVDHGIDWKRYLEKADNRGHIGWKANSLESYNYEAFAKYSPSLREHLQGQLSLMKLKKDQSYVGNLIIQNIDENGYLAISLDEIARSLKMEESRVEEVLKLVQDLNPLGVGARSLKESLLIQLRENKDIDPIVEQVIEDHLEDLASNRMVKISKQLNIDLKKLEEVCEFIKNLEPKPGRAFSRDFHNVEYIIPDASVEVVDGEYIISINEIAGPRLSINNFYKKLIRENPDKEASDFLSQSLNSAVWIIKSIEQRRQTIYHILESILKFQREFFQSGDKALVPLTLKEVALDINMHESTVSRATREKYVQTPKGLYELRYFFSAGLSGEDDDISSTSVKSIIKDLIKDEEETKPYSDQKIVDLLKEKGVSISRRTVAKYRLELEIPSSYLRRKFL